MIIARSPLRITLGGGGTDLPSYYREHEGFLIAAAIDKYVYITIHQTFVEELIVKYSKLERVSHARDLEHPIIREAFDLMRNNGNSLEVASMADIPAGTGLGSSGSFTTALLRALHHLHKLPINAAALAEMACDIEINRLKEPVGKQDQYIAAFGGVTCFSFKKDDGVSVVPLECSEETLHNLEDNLLLFFTGYSRPASAILKEQDSRSRERDKDMTANLHFVKGIGLQSLAALSSGDLREFGRLMHEHWHYKKKRAATMSNDHVDQWYDIGMKNGAIGGKLVGAGGGGFLMFYTEERMRLRHAMTEIGLTEVRFRFDFEGSKVLVG
jgi:D-glycero-alpha-D-manno-heptose-7-phosphate kinase